MVFQENGRIVHYHVVRPRINPAGQWELQTVIYPDTELEQWHYYHLTGVLDGSDYGTGDKEWQENISVIVLARNEEEAWQLSGYRKGSYWMWGGPNLRPIEGFDDELWVIAERFKSRVLENMGWNLGEVSRPGRRRPRVEINQQGEKMELQQITDELKKWHKQNQAKIGNDARKAGIFSDVNFALGMVISDLAMIANHLTNYTPYRKTGKELYREFVDIRKELFDRIEHSQEQQVQGPARIVHIVYDTPGTKYIRGDWHFEHKQLHPGEEFTGKCIAYDIGIYD